MQDWDCGEKYTIKPKRESCTKEEFVKFLENYPNKLEQDFYMDAISFNDFSLAKKWPASVVAMIYLPMARSESSTYAIATNMDEVFASMKGEEIMGESERLAKAKEIIKENFSSYDCGLFNSRNLLGDPMGTIYNEDGLTIDVCDYYSYFEVFGLTDDEFEELKDFYKGLQADS